jgi:UDP-glucuronate 4-epimerase
MGRDFTYVSDLVVAIELLAKQIPKTNTPVQVEGVADSISPVAPWRVVNIAGGQTVGLMDYLDAIEHHMGVVADKRFLPMQAGDVTTTRADPALLRALTGYEPRTSVIDGVGAFVAWYQEYHGGE